MTENNPVPIHLPRSCAPTRREGRDVFSLGEDNSLHSLAEPRERTDCHSQPVGAREIGGEQVQKLPLVFSAVQAGFSSSADEHIERYLDLNELVVKHPAATFFVRVSGNSMQGAGIQSGDILVVDRSLTPVSGKIIVACLNGEFLVKELKLVGKRVVLAAANPRYPDIKINPEEADFRVWGVVTHVIHEC